MNSPINYKIAYDLRVIGYDEPSVLYYLDRNAPEISSDPLYRNKRNSELPEEMCSAPEISDIISWLQREKNILFSFDMKHDDEFNRPLFGAKVVRYTEMGQVLNVIYHRDDFSSFDFSVINAIKATVSFLYSQINSYLSRKITFRGKSLRDGSWVYGYLVRNGHVSLIYKDDNSSVKVDNFSVGQSTNFKDKNDVTIYENDIVLSDKGNYHYVVWNALNGSFSFTDLYLKKDEREHLFFANSNKLEVVGNGFENGNLFKELRNRKRD